MFRSNHSVVLLLGFLLAFGPVAVAQDSARHLPSVSQQEAQRAARAGQVVSNMPVESMIRGAEAVAVIPGVRKGAFLFGGRWGKGLMTVRGEDGHWKPPAFIEIGGGNFGLQAGYESTDLVLIFTDDSTVKSLLRGKLTLSADGSAASPVLGRHASGGIPITMTSGIYSYSSAKGLFAGVSLDGAVITIDDTSNARVYGKYVNGDEILLDNRIASNDAVAPFLKAMEQSSPGRASSRIQTGD